MKTTKQANTVNSKKTANKPAALSLYEMVERKMRAAKRRDTEDLYSMLGEDDLLAMEADDDVACYMGRRVRFAEAGWN